MGRKLWPCTMLALICLFVSCKPTKDTTVEWSLFSQHTFGTLSKKEKTYARKFQTENFYVPLFSVDYHKDKGVPIPLGSQKLDIRKDSAFNLAPSIWVSNRIFLKSDTAQLAKLANQMSQRIVQLTDSVPLGEILFDCDWTPETKDAYFKLIQAVRGGLPYGVEKFSATLPLHYLRYQDTTGIPPVDKILLKLVNQINLQTINEEADPLEIALVKPYLMDLQAYGTEVVIGIPFGNWGILVRKNDPLRLFIGLTENEIKNKGEFIPVDETLIKVGEDAYFKGEFLNRGDFIRIENYQNASIKALYPLLLEFTRNDTLKICLINLEQNFEDRYPPDLVRRWFTEID